MAFIILLLKLSFLTLCLASDESVKNEDKRAERGLNLAQLPQGDVPQNPIGPLFYSLSENSSGEKWPLGQAQLQGQASPATENALNYAFQSQTQDGEYLSQEQMQSNNNALDNKIPFVLSNQQADQPYNLNALQAEQILNLKNTQSDQQLQLNSLNLLNDRLKLENAELTSKLSNGNQNIWQAPDTYFGLTYGLSGSEQTINSKNVLEKASNQQPDSKTTIPLSYSFSNIAYGPDLAANYESQQQNQQQLHRQGPIFLVDDMINNQGAANFAVQNKNNDANQLSGQALIDQLVKARYLSGSIDQYQPQDKTLPLQASQATPIVNPIATPSKTFKAGFGKLSLSNLAAQQLIKSIINAPSIPIGQKIEVVKHVPYAVIRHIPIHIPQPYAVPVPHAVKVAIPQPYPVHIEVEKPVPYPVIKLQKVIVEKRVPYPVEKFVPYAVEKPYPVPIVKKVHVPIETRSGPIPITIVRSNSLKRPSWHK